MLLSNEAAKEVTSRIEILTQKNIALKEELLRLERENLFNSLDKYNLDALHDNIKQFVDATSFETKKRLAKLIFSKIVWDSDKKEIQILLAK
jgi:hypothetical protein